MSEPRQSDHPARLGVRDARPPQAISRILNPLNHFLLGTRAGRAIDSLAIIEFTGRRTGRRLSAVVGWHDVGGQPAVFTPAAWRVNFAGGTAATVTWRGHREERIGTLELDPAVVAAAIAAVIDDGTSPRALALHMPAGHIVTPEDVRETNRAMIRFGPPLA